MTEELAVLKSVTGRLEAAGIPYMMTGSFAANYYAVPRMTRDIDLVVELDRKSTRLNSSHSRASRMPSSA